MWQLRHTPFSQFLLFIFCFIDYISTFIDPGKIVRVFFKLISEEIRGFPKIEGTREGSSQTFSSPGTSPIDFLWDEGFRKGSTGEPRWSDNSQPCFPARSTPSRIPSPLTVNNHQIVGLSSPSVSPNQQFLPNHSFLSNQPFSPSSRFSPTSNHFLPSIFPASSFSPPSSLFLISSFCPPEVGPARAPPRDG